MRFNIIRVIRGTLYNLILSDINMPNLDGFKLIEMKSQKEIDTPVMLMTSSESTEDEIRGYELGAVDYIKKPIQKEILLLRVKALTKRHKGEQDKND